MQQVDQGEEAQDPAVVSEIVCRQVEMTSLRPPVGHRLVAVDVRTRWQRLSNDCLASVAPYALCPFSDTVMGVLPLVIHVGAASRLLENWLHIRNDVVLSHHGRPSIVAPSRRCVLETVCQRRHRRPVAEPSRADGRPAGEGFPVRDGVYRHAVEDSAAVRGGGVVGVQAGPGRQESPAGEDAST